MFNVAEIISTAETVLFQFQKLIIGIISKLFSNNFISHVTTAFRQQQVRVRMSE